MAMIDRCLLVLALLSAIPGFAAETAFRVLGVQGKVLFERTLSSPSGTLGQATDQALNQALSEKKLRQYAGSDAGVVSINGLGGALEVLSDAEMNAYGWCYRVDGRSSDLLASEYVLTGKEARIDWYYAYAHLDKDTWTSMCEPADHEPAQENQAGISSP